jgi:outer membrane protein OmpA-like peptidoglycan-associated protein
MQATSAHNRPLTYSYYATAGHIEGAGATVTVDTTGVEGNIVVICTATDDLGLAGRDAAAINITAPAGGAVSSGAGRGFPAAAAPPPESAGGVPAGVPAEAAPEAAAGGIPMEAPPPHAEGAGRQPGAGLAEDECLHLCSIHFERDVRRPARVDNEAKACLDDIALAMQQHPGGTLVITGEADASESNRQPLSAARALNERQYLVLEKKIDPARLELVTGGHNEKQVENVLVPAGSKLPITGKAPVTDQTLVHPEAYGTHAPPESGQPTTPPKHKRSKGHPETPPE